VPTYQYACVDCDEKLEVVQKFTDEPLSECPSCSGRLRKVFSAVGVVFKGSGFYRTDSRAENGKGKSSSSGESSSTSSSSDSKGSSDGGSGGKSSGDKSVGAAA